MPTVLISAETVKGKPGLSQRIAIVLLITCVVLMAVTYSLTRPQHDFIEYWTAAHLLAAKHNPYSMSEMFQAQRALGWAQSVPLMFLSPPWTLMFIAPLGLTGSYALGVLLWLVALAGIVGLSSWLLMNVYFGQLHIPEISDTVLSRCLFAFTFYPVLLCFRFAQTAPFMLLGLAGFLYFETKGRRIPAGAFLSLTLMNPQLLYLVSVALICRSVQRRQWRVLGSAIFSILLLTILTLLLDRHLMDQYWELVRGPYAQVIPSGIVAPIRKLFGGGAFWLQFVPPLFGIIWFRAYWRRRRDNWCWQESMPALVTASVFTSAYGWLFDQAVLALPVIALAAAGARAHGHLPRRLVVLYTLLNCMLMLVMGAPPLAFVPAPVFLSIVLWYEAKRVPMLNLPVSPIAAG